MPLTIFYLKSIIGKNIMFFRWDKHVQGFYLNKHANTKKNRGFVYKKTVFQPVIL